MVNHATRNHSNHRLTLNLSWRNPAVNRATEANNEWNLRTVVLLNRSGLIKIQSERPPNIERRDDETIEQLQLRRDKAMAEFAVACPVTLLDDSHLDPNRWIERVEPVRLEMLKSGWKNLAVMEKVLQGGYELSQILSEVYTLRGNGLNVDPVPVCGGCPFCRDMNCHESNFVLPEPDAIQCVQSAPDPAIRRLLRATTNLVLVACPRSGSGTIFLKKLFQFVLRKLVHLGIREIAAPAGLQSDKQCRELYRHSSSGFLIHRTLSETDKLRTDLKIPRVTLFLTDSVEPIPEVIINIERPLHVIFAWDDTPDRNRPESRLFDRAVHSRFNDLLGRLDQ